MLAQCANGDLQTLIEHSIKLWQVFQSSLNLRWGGTWNRHQILFVPLYLQKFTQPFSSWDFIKLLFPYAFNKDWMFLVIKWELLLPICKPHIFILYLYSIILGSQPTIEASFKTHEINKCLLCCGIWNFIPIYFLCSIVLHFILL